MKCVICKKEVEPGSPYVPFCSDRCRLIDLGKWAAEEYRISTPATPQVEDDDESDTGTRER